MRDPELTKVYLEENYLHLGKTRAQISSETGVSPIRIGTLLQKYGVKRYSVRRHGLNTHPLYTMWCGMKERCNNANADNYKWYGGKGVAVCEEWYDFNTFYQWAMRNGWEPGLSIDRVDGSLGYNPENCRLISHKQQCRNRRSNVALTVNGVSKLQCEWEEALGLRNKIISQWKNRYGEEYAIKRIEEELSKKCASKA